MAGGDPVHQLTSVFKVVLAYALGRQFCQHIVQVVGVRVAVAGQIGTKLRLVVNLVPHHRVRLACGARCADGEDEASVPGHDQELENLKRWSQDNDGDFISIYSSANELSAVFFFLPFCPSRCRGGNSVEGSLSH